MVADRSQGHHCTVSRPPPGRRFPRRAVPLAPYGACRGRWLCAMLSGCGRTRLRSP